MRVGWSGWSVEVPEACGIADDPECLTLELSDRGALQLSSATKRRGVIEPGELLELSGAGWGVPSSVEFGSFTGIAFEYREDDHQWKRWLVCDGMLLVFATYNGEPNVAANEIAASEVILSTLRTEG